MFEWPSHGLRLPHSPGPGLGAERTAAVDSAPLPRPCTPQPGRVLLVCGTLPAFNAHVRGPRGNAARGENTLRCGHVIAKSQGDGRGDVPRGARGSERGPVSRAAPGDVGPPPCPRRLAPPRQDGWKDKSHQWRRGLCCLVCDPSHLFSEPWFRELAHSSRSAVEKS